MSSANSLVNKPTLIEWGPLRLLIMDAPKDSNLHLYLKQCKKTNVTSIVRISEPSYSREEVEKAGIALHVSGNYISAIDYTLGDYSVNLTIEYFD